MSPVLRISYALQISRAAANSETKRRDGKPKAFATYKNYNFRKNFERFSVETLRNKEGGATLSQISKIFCNNNIFTISGASHFTRLTLNNTFAVLVLFVHDFMNLSKLLSLYC